MIIEVEYFELAMIPMYFGFTTDKAAFEREMKRLEISPVPEFTGKTAACTHSLINNASGKITCIVCVDLSKLKAGKSAMLALLVHEAVHVWQNALEAMSAENPRGEFEAYTIQYFSQLMFDYIERKNKQKPSP